MKIRNGFVSNSSTSSFFCPVCDNHYEIMDGDPTNESHLAQCKKGHSFCLFHMDTEDNKEKIKNAIKNFLQNKNKDIPISTIEELDTFSSDDASSFEDSMLFWEFKNSLPLELCPFCSFVTIYDYEMYSYLFIKNGKSKKEIVADIKKEFNDNYDAFSEYIKKDKENHIAKGVDDED